MAVLGVTPFALDDYLRLRKILHADDTDDVPPAEKERLLAQNEANIAAYLDAPSIGFYVFFSMRSEEQFRKAHDFAQQITGSSFVPLDVFTGTQHDQGDLETRMLERSRAAVGLVMAETFGWISEVSAMRAKGVAPILVTQDPKMYRNFHEQHVFRTFDALREPKTVVVGKRKRDFGEAVRIPFNSKVGMHVINADGRHQWRKKMRYCMDEALSASPRVYARARPSRFIDRKIAQYACWHCHATLYEENAWHPSSWIMQVEKDVTPRQRTLLPNLSSEYD